MNHGYDQLKKIINVALTLLELHHERNTVNLLLQFFDLPFDFGDHILVLERFKSHDFLLLFLNGFIRF